MAHLKSKEHSNPHPLPWNGKIAFVGGVTVNLCSRVRVLGLKIFSKLEGMARTKNTVSREEIGAQELKGMRGARRAQTALYRKSKELERGKSANKVGDLPNEASAAPGSNVLGKALAIWTSQDSQLGLFTNRPYNIYN
ncbi:hypothetical protein Scep_017096 [Stephania cephalantha]|uniref:Uncharacterized protein n=1 Tax=Stephania cephalantha TaxID=152367 RepID=A0AAP0NTX4_9MAGN